MLKRIQFFILLTSFSISALTQVLVNNMHCPESPNCVSSKDTKTSHYIKPFTFSDSPDEAINRLKEALLQEKRVMIVTYDPAVLRAEVRSFLFKFVDDVEFTLLAEEGVIHVRSASRSGYYDFGVNRSRIERIRHLFQQ